MNNSKVTAKYNKARISPKKVAPVLDLVRGKGLEEAKLILAFDATKAAKMILKTLKSAESNAKNNQKLTADKLFVSEIFVNGGDMQKSARFVGRGRVNPILKRTSHIFVGLSEREK
jgi:large subunit ribosomal protein L22